MDLSGLLTSSVCWWNGSHCETQTKDFVCGSVTYGGCFDTAPFLREGKLQLDEMCFFLFLPSFLSCPARSVVNAEDKEGSSGKRDCRRLEKVRVPVTRVGQSDDRLWEGRRFLRSPRYTIPPWEHQEVAQKDNLFHSLPIPSFTVVFFLLC